MLQLAIECSGFHGSFSLARGANIVETVQLPTGQSSVQSLALCISRSLRQHDFLPNFISVTNGPGSFTGIRVGLATAKMLGLAWNIPIAPIDTLEALALQMRTQLSIPEPAVLVPVLDAFRQQVFTAAWSCLPSRPIARISPSQIVAANKWQQAPVHSQAELDMAVLKDSGGKNPRDDANYLMVIAGPGLERYSVTDANVLDSCDGKSKSLVIPGLAPQAREVAELGWRLAQSNQVTNSHMLNANYLRASAAEEKLPK